MNIYSRHSLAYKMVIMDYWRIQESGRVRDIQPDLMTWRTVVWLLATLDDVQSIAVSPQQLGSSRRVPVVNIR